MKKNVLILFLFVTPCSFIKAQNLVPNYSFEDTVKCSNYWNQFVGYVTSWGGGGDGVCYFSSFCESSGDTVGVQHNYFGHQQPHTGYAYAGLYTYLSPLAPDTNIRDYVQAKLATPLLANVTYYATFYVSLADSEHYACSNMGIYFSDSALNYPMDTYIKSYLTPQIQNDPIHNPLTSKTKWTKISGKYKAVGGEQYMGIGNFTPSYLCDTVYFPSGCLPSEISAFYYVDDVILSTDSNYADSLMGIDEVKVDRGKGKVYPNPNNGRFNIELSEVSSQSFVEVYDMLGEKIYSTKLNATDTQIDLSNRASGIYFYRLITGGGDLISEGKFILDSRVPFG